MLNWCWVLMSLVSNRLRDLDIRCLYIPWTVFLLISSRSQARGPKGMWGLLDLGYDLLGIPSHLYTRDCLLFTKKSQSRSGRFQESIETFPRHGCTQTLTSIHSLVGDWFTFQQKDVQKKNKPTWRCRKNRFIGALRIRFHAISQIFFKSHLLFCRIWTPFGRLGWKTPFPLPTASFYWSFCSLQ